MVAAPLCNSIIMYKPSSNMVHFIRSLTLCDFKDIPINIADICVGKPHNEQVKVRKSTTAQKVSFLENSDLEFIHQLEELDIDGIEHERDNSLGENATSNKTDILLTFEDLQWLYTLTAKQNEHANASTYVYFHKLFQGSEIMLPENVNVPRSKELEQRCERLRVQQENIKYKAMTKNVDNTRQTLPDETIAYQMRQMNSQIIAVFQFVVSVLAGFAFGFIGIELLIGTLDFGFRLLLGIICALTVALAELYFLAKKLNEDVEMTYKETSITSHHCNAKLKND